MCMRSCLVDNLFVCFMKLSKICDLKHYDCDCFSYESSLPFSSHYSQSIAKHKSNIGKNRDPNIIPYDHNRVSLDKNENDYINANYVDGYIRRRAYIVAQSPFDASGARDFWLMIFQQNIGQIVMLTNCMEDSSIKCYRYWPEVRLD